MDLIQKNEQHTGKASQLRTILKITTMSLVTLALILGLGLVSFDWVWNKYMTVYRGIDISLLSKEPPRATVFYDSNGEVITELTNSRMEYMPLDQFPKIVQEAVISVEDARFYEHKGVDFQGIARALYKNWKSGETVQGGSTITQQLAKTFLFSSEQTYSRKIKEAIASLKIEKTYTKEQIMELYLNHIYFGEGSWGLERAAQSYFGKPALDLTLSESALLAGIPKSPTNYSPVKKPEQAKERRNLILNLMAEQGRITAAERDAAKSEEIQLVAQSGPKVAKHPSFIDHVMSEAIEKYKLTEEQILSSGYQIYTTMAPKVQVAAEEVYSDDSFFPKDAGGLQSGIVLMEPQTGALLGIVGSRTPQQEFRAFNYATQNQRQPGSTLKPIIVYAPALSEGFGIKDQIHDVETDFGGAYKPANYGNKLHGWVTLEEALVQSYNIPAVALLKEIGIDKGMELASLAGLPLQETDRTLGIALGGMTKGTSPLAMAQAYTMFANNGNLAKAYAITKIVDRQGNLVGEESVPILEPILDPNVAFTMTTMLRKAVNQGTGQSARMDRPVAGKTGTTQLPDIPEFKDKRGNQIDGSKDAWFVGYTPEIVAAVWLGYEKTNKEHYLTTTGGKYPAVLFNEVVSRALQDVPVVDFARPKAFAAVVGGKKKINEDKQVTLAEARKKWKQAKEAQALEEEAALAAEKTQTASGASACAGAPTSATAGACAAAGTVAPNGSDKGAATPISADKGPIAHASGGKDVTTPPSADKSKAVPPEGAPLSNSTLVGSNTVGGAATGAGSNPPAKVEPGAASTPAAQASQPAPAVPAPPQEPVTNKPKTDRPTNEGPTVKTDKDASVEKPVAQPKAESNPSPSPSSAPSSPGTFSNTGVGVTAN